MERYRDGEAWANCSMFRANVRWYHEAFITVMIYPAVSLSLGVQMHNVRAQKI
jgi:hypothetical protein